MTWIVIPAYAGIQSSDWLDAGLRRHDEGARWPLTLMRPVIVTPANAGVQVGHWLDAGLRRHDEDIFAPLHPIGRAGSVSQLSLSSFRESITFGLCFIGSEGQEEAATRFLGAFEAELPS